MRSGLLAIALVACGVLVAVHADTAFASTTPNWTTGVRVVLPADAASDSQSTLESVSCATPGNCSAIGSYQDSSGHSQALLVTQSSDAWSAGIKAPLPGDAGPDPSVFVRSVSCASPGNCVAVGAYKDSSANTQGLVLSESSGSWTATKALLPGDAAANPLAVVTGVSCASPGNCTAVGSYKDSSANSQGLLLDDEAGSWGAAKVTPPGDAAVNPAVNVGSVSCATAGNCVAIGGYRDNLAQNQALLVSESSGVWAAGMRPPLPSDGGTSGGGGLFSVSCPAAGNCSVGGAYYDTSMHNHGLLLSESAGTWSAHKASLPPDAAATTSGGAVNSVSCVSAGECAAGGNYTDASGHLQGVLLTESSGTWATGIEAPVPPDAGADPNGYVATVSCVSAASCSAVGSYEDSSGHTQGLLLSESAGTWSPGIKAPVPADAAADPEVELGALSCASAGSCTTVSSYQNNANQDQGLLLSATPANPALALSAPTAGTVGRALAASRLGAALSAGASPIGAITFTVFGPQASAPGTCAPGGKVVGSASVSGNGAYHPSAGFTPTKAGRYWWHVAYSGDTGDNPSSSACGASMAKTVVTPFPRITHLSESHRRWRRGRKLPHIASSTLPPVGTTFRFTVNQRVRLRFTFTKRVKGHKVGRRCVARGGKGRRCTRTVRAGAVGFRAHAGRNKVRFQGRISARKRLRPGRYTVTVTATDPAGQKSARRSLKFTIV